MPNTPDIRQLRRRAIVLAKLDGATRAERWVPARNFMRLMDDQGVRIETEDAVIEVLMHLMEHQLIEEWRPMGIGDKSQGFGQRRFRLTDRGYALWSQSIDPIPSIADDRQGD